MYVKETCVCGSVIEVRKYYTRRFNREGQKRGPNVGTSGEKTAKINEKYSEMMLRRIINTNFNHNDIHLVLTYRKENRPTPGQGRKDLQLFLRRMREEYRRRGSELKYVAVTEYMASAIHHHLVINNIDMETIIRLWPHGQPRPTYLHRNGDYSKLAMYLVKETNRHLKRGQPIGEHEKASGKRWSCSRNLIRPKAKKEIIAADSWTKTPRATAGFYIDTDSIEYGITEEGYPFQRYRMCKIVPETKKHARKLRRESVYDFDS